MGGFAGLGLRSQGSFGRWGLSRCRAMGIGLLRSYARYGPVPLTPVCGWGKGEFFWGGVDGEWGFEVRRCVPWEASRGWACARRDRSGGEGFRAVALWGNRVLRSNARYGPVPLTPVCGRGMGVFLLGRG